MNRLNPKTPPLRSAMALAACSALIAGGCSSIEGTLAGDKVDYRSQTTRTSPLEVPPDLTQLARDSRYRPQGGVISASGAPATGTAPAATAAGLTTVAPAAVGAIRVERQGSQRWLVVPMTPEQLWPQLKAFWPERGFTIESESIDTGVMETGWAENRAKIPQDFIRGAIGKMFDAAYSTSERDRFRTRVERTATGTEVYISHRGMEEIYTSTQRDNTAWRSRPADPQLEAEFLSRLMVKLGAREEAATAALAAAVEPPPRARPVAAAGATSVEIDDGFDRAWRRVGLALDRTGFTVEDRDRAAGVYFVRYVDPKTAGKEDPGFLTRLFSSEAKGGAPVRLRVLVKADGAKSVVSVQNSTGAPETGEAAQRIVGLLVTELK